jgi:hypothetical protein
MSWGTNEFWGEWNYNSVFTTPAGHNNVTFVASSGDSGAWAGPSFPSVAPNVLAVGGTTLSLGSGNTYGSEAGWTDSTGGFSGFDNGYWYGEAEPSYQTATLTAAGLSYGLRTTPDVSFNAGPNSGVSVYDSVSYGGQSGWFQLGGTSAAAPAWAGLVAVTDQGLATGGKGTLSTTQLLNDLYALPKTDFHDITSGFNGYSATAGYDLVSGLGTPRANLLVTGLLAAHGVSTGAATTTTAVAVTLSTSSTHHSTVVTSSSSNGSTSGGGSSSSSNSSSSPVAAGTTTAVAVFVPAPAQAFTGLPMQALATPNGTGVSAAVSQAPAGGPSVLQVLASSPSLGQGLAPQLTMSRWETRTESEPVLTLDAIELEQPAAVPEPAPAQSSADPVPAPRPAPTPEPAPAQPAAPAAPPLDPLPADWDQVLARAAEGLSAGRVEPMAADPDPDSSQDRGAPRSVAALVGAAAVVAAGYRLVLGQSSPRERRRPGFRFLESLNGELEGTRGDKPHRDRGSRGQDVG